MKILKGVLGRAVFTSVSTITCSLLIVFCTAATFADTPKPNYAKSLFQDENPLYQTCRPVLVAFMQRPLAFDKLGIVRDKLEASAVHVQVVEMDLSTGKILDNFGFTGDNGQRGRVLIESSDFIRRNYGQTLGSVTMSSECYDRAKAATVKQLNGAIYSIFNKYYTDYGQVVSDGAKAGSAVGSKAGRVIGTAAGLVQGWPGGAGSIGGSLGGGALGTVSGAAGGTVAAAEIGYENLKKWKSDGRHDYLQSSDKVKEMSVPGFNCQVVPELFLKNCVDDPSVKILQEYHQPGEMVGDVKTTNNGQSTSPPDLHSLNLDDPNGDWCKCEERGEKPGCDANMEASEKGYVIFGCTKCKKVNVKYAKMALSLEQKMKDAGVKGMWHGPNAEVNARKAASESNK